MFIEHPDGPPRARQPLPPRNDPSALPQPDPYTEWLNKQARKKLAIYTRCDVAIHGAEGSKKPRPAAGNSQKASHEAPLQCPGPGWVPTPCQLSRPVETGQDGKSQSVGGCLADSKGFDHAFWIQRSSGVSHFHAARRLEAPSKHRSRRRPVSERVPSSRNTASSVHSTLPIALHPTLPS